jgi:putative ABC transport system ATP-binding protein
MVIALDIENVRPRSTVESQVPLIHDPVRLSDESKGLPSALSGGEREGIAVARALVNRPLILFADESTGPFDKTNPKSIMALLERTGRTSTTIDMATNGNVLGTQCDDASSHSTRAN